MEPGNTYKLTLRNTAADSSLYTNIHTHGLHISGSGDADDITRKVPGGSCLDYTWDIPSDHPGGTYWYHPHYHTQTNTQTAGGAFGMIIIEEKATNTLNPWASDIANELVLLVSDAGSLLGNGNKNEVLQIEVNRWYRLRTSVVTPGARASDLKFVGNSCTVYNVASDGVWHNAALTAYAESSFTMTGASRKDFAIKCSAAESVDVNWGRKTAATLQVGSFGSGTGQSSTGDDVNDLGVAPSAPPSLDWSNPYTPCATCSYSVALSGAQINGESWDEFNPLDVIDYGNVYEWTISGSGAHPFHLHLYHMKIVSPGGCGAHKEGEFYDTISASGSCVVQFKAIDIGQRMVMHCHVLSHEDNGAMHWIDVTGTPNPNEVVSPSYTCSSAETGPPNPSPVASPVDAPVASPTEPPVEGPTCSTTTCTRNSDCCIGRCNRRTEKCLNQRFLRNDAGFT